MSADPAAEPPAYRRLFWRGAEHAWLAVGTLGLGFVSGEPLGLLVGGAAYALGLVYLPDSGWFRRRVDARRARAAAAEDAVRLAEFQQQRARMIEQLSAERRRRHHSLAAVCADISGASAATGDGELSLSLDSRLRKLDELLWTHLRLLTIEQSLETYLETERRDQLAEAAETAEREVAALEAELGASAPPAGADARDTRRRLLDSRRERLEALRSRVARVAQARANHELARSEQERLVEQAKLVRADAVARRDAGTLGARIDLSIEHLAETNRWLADLAEFKDLTDRLPPLPAGAMLAPPAAARATPPPLRETT